MWLLSLMPPIAFFKKALAAATSEIIARTTNPSRRNLHVKLTPLDASQLLLRPRRLRSVEAKGQEVALHGTVA